MRLNSFFTVIIREGRKNKIHFRKHPFMAIMVIHIFNIRRGTMQRERSLLVKKNLWIWLMLRTLELPATQSHSKWLWQKGLFMQAWDEKRITYEGWRPRWHRQNKAIWFGCIHVKKVFSHSEDDHWNLKKEYFGCWERAKTLRPGYMLHWMFPRI